MMRLECKPLMSWNFIRDQPRMCSIEIDNTADALWLLIGTEDVPDVFPASRPLRYRLDMHEA